ncbi:pyruvate dehydrogenase E2 component (dihydrolipoamide acetyltransferase) [Oryzihumus leptocrescens]|uniref:Dihydrolipoamide acetyltransferase component of pyruvate dehydrogenase complex n=4 Tax=Oryzihumus leptocrescens TaxID=297536 RepID=A0A542ZJH3_9MICO|nr:pyruvate dehydrogenase E2 component (dihydrolipoamide acetyltransferase) [Oryzihumus leptocrescens]
MPSLGADMDEGTLLEWLVRPGEPVSAGQVVAVVDTAKSAVEVEAFESGVMGEQVVGPGTKVPVGAPLARILPAGAGAGVGAAAPEPAAPAPAAQPMAPVLAPRAEQPPRPAAAASAAPGPPAAAPLATPLVRHLAGELGVDLTAVRGTGPRGRILREDVEREALAAHEVAAPAGLGGELPAAAGRARAAATGIPVAVPAGVPAVTGIPAAVTATGTAVGERRARVSPYARRLAAELGVALGDLLPGPSGAVTAAEVRAGAQAPRAAAMTAAAAEVAPPAAPAAEEGPAPSATPGADGADPMRQAIARLMARSNREVPHYYLETTIELSEPLAWMHARNRELDVARRIVPAALVLRAVAQAAAKHPELNGFWVEDAFRPGEGVHLGVAISLRGGGIVAPAIHHADRLSTVELMGRLRDLVERARARRLRRTELADPTITVTNLGEQGVDLVHGVIHPPQVALVGVGRVLERPWAVDGMLGVRPVVRVTLAADHRATDGFVGSRFLTEVDRQLHTLEEP